MTEQEAIRVAIEHIKERNMSATHLDMSIKALEKQIAKKPYILPISTIDIFTYCPNCKTGGHLIAPSMSYCCDCGQKLDWGNEDEE